MINFSQVNIIKRFSIGYNIRNHRINCRNRNRINDFESSYISEMRNRIGNDQNFQGIFFFAQHLVFRNFYNNLVSKNTSNKVYEKHILDSLTINKIIQVFWPKQNYNCVDIGTGGGLPGFLLSSLFSSIFVSLLDSVFRKTLFHKGLLLFSHTKNFRTLNTRVEFLENILIFRERYNLLISRAVAEINILLNISYFKISKNGKFLFMKQAKDFNEEIKQSQKILKVKNYKFKSFINIDQKSNSKIIVIGKKITF